MPTILVVDDELSILNLLRNFFQTLGYRVETASSGYEALDKARRVSFDLVCLDVIMPEMDGYETCRRLKEIPGAHYAPVLMVTGLDDVEAKAASSDSGADDFISKPLRLKELGIRVNSMLRIKSQYDELQQKNRQLDEANHFKSRLLAVAAHDTRALFEEILEGLDACADASSPVRKACDSFRELLDCLREVAAIESGALEVTLSKVRLDEAITECICAVGERLAGRDIAVDAGELSVLADEGKLSRVLSALLDNAVRFSSPSSPVAVATLHCGDKARVSVVDRGPGLAPGEISSIFAPFYRLPRDEGQGGFGLGLYFVRSYVEAMGGEVAVESGESGSSFSFTVPLMS